MARPGRWAERAGEARLTPIPGVSAPPWGMDYRGGRPDPSSRPGSRDAGGLRAAELRDRVQGLARDGDLGRLAAVRARPQRVPDHPLVAADGSLGRSTTIVAELFCPPVRPRSATDRRWRSRWVGAVSAAPLGTASRRG